MNVWVGTGQPNKCVGGTPHIKVGGGAAAASGAGPATHPIDRHAGITEFAAQTGLCV